MKHLLNGVAIAAALVIAAPVWAQAPKPEAAPAPPAPAATAPAPAAAAPADKAPMKPMAMKQRHRRPMRHMAGRRHMHRMMNAGDATTNQLNREELARIQGGPPGPPPSGATPFNKGQ